VIAAACVVAGSATADPGTVASKQAEAQRIVAQINSINQQLGVAVERWNNANVKLDRIDKNLKRTKHELGVARVNLKRSQIALSRQALAVYTSLDSNSTMEVLLGASSLDDLISRIDTVNRVNDQRSSLVGDVKHFQTSVRKQAAQLRSAQRSQRQIVAQRAAEKRSIQSQLAQRNRLLSSVRGEIAHLRAVEASRQLALARQARERIQQQQTGFNGIGIGASTPDATVAPPSHYGGVVGIAMRYLGIPYVWAGASPSGFDCSGFVMYVYAQMGVSLPHSSYAQYGYGVSVPFDQLQAGDLVFFDGLGHVGIYIGGGQFIHSPHTGDVVKISALTGWYSSTYVGARRIL
jgi:cell wall-associated NlpC family hydrolase